MKYFKAQLESGKVKNEANATVLLILQWTRINMYDLVCGLFYFFNP